MNIRKPYDNHERVSFETLGPSMTKQSHKRETDINFIMDKYTKTGLVSHASSRQGQYGEFEALDFQEAMNYVIDAQETFMELPSSMRKRFGNDPHEFLEFVQDENNRDEMIKMGLMNPPEPSPEPSKDEPAPSPQGDE